MGLVEDLLSTVKKRKVRHDAISNDISKMIRQGTVSGRRNIILSEDNIKELT